MRMCQPLQQVTSGCHGCYRGGTIADKFTAGLLSGVRCSLQELVTCYIMQGGQQGFEAIKAAAALAWAW